MAGVGLHAGQQPGGLEEVGHDPVLPDDLLVRRRRPRRCRALEEGQQLAVVHELEDLVVVGGRLVERVAGQRVEDPVDALGQLGTRQSARRPRPRASGGAAASSGDQITGMLTAAASHPFRTAPAG